MACCLPHPVKEERCPCDPDGFSAPDLDARAFRTGRVAPEEIAVASRRARKGVHQLSRPPDPAASLTVMVRKVKVLHRK